MAEYTPLLSAPSSSNPQTTSIASILKQSNSWRSPFKTNCRLSRPPDKRVYKTKAFLLRVLHFMFYTAGYNRRTTLLRNLYNLILLIICWYQVMFESFRAMNCPNFKCRHGATPPSSSKQLEYSSYLSASLGSALSYTFMICCLNIAHQG